MAKNKKDDFPHYWLCTICAKEKGGVWPKDHVATMIRQQCRYCDGANQADEKAMIIAPYIDYDWPQDGRLDYYSKMTRD